jgi:hypothetical protein
LHDFSANSWFPIPVGKEHQIEMKKVFLTTAFLILITFSFAGITSAFLEGDSILPPMPESFILLLLGSGLIGFAIWRRRKYR